METPEVSRLTQCIPRERRFRLNRMLLDSRVGGPYMEMRSAYAPYRAQSDASLIIDGFPRSANTYALFAAQLMLGDDQVRGHTHAVATLERGVAWGVPTVLLVREPRAVVASMVQLVHGLPIAAGFEAYSRFHTRLTGLREFLYVAQFDDVVNDFGNVMARVNDRFGASLPAYEKSDENERLIRARIDESSAIQHEGRVREAGVARPSGKRRSAEDVLAGMGHMAERSCRRAEEAYAAILKV